MAFMDLSTTDFKSLCAESTKTNKVASPAAVKTFLNILASTRDTSPGRIHGLRVSGQYNTSYADCFCMQCLEASDPAGPNPEAFAPLAARWDHLQIGILALVGQVHG